jgi:D-proline reductase (dithiol) PrdB
MPRLELLSEVQRRTLLNFPCIEHEDAPCTPLTKPLAQATLALVTTAGLHVRGDAPFLHVPQGDTSYRVIPLGTDPHDIVQSDTSIGFDRTAIYRDLNVSFPLDRLRELAARKVIGDLGKSCYSFNGALRDPRRIRDETGPEVGRLLKADGVDAVLITPT